MENNLILLIGGIFSGLLAGLMGIGGGTVLVPLLVGLQYTPVEAVATSSLAIVMTSLSGSIQNWRMGYLAMDKVVAMGIPALLTAQIGVKLANLLPPYLLLNAFGLFLLINITLSRFRRQLAQGEKDDEKVNQNPLLARLFTGGSAGILAGLFGVGGGVIMVPLQLLWLNEGVKVAIQTSLGVIVITAVSACFGHALNHNVLWIQGLLLGIGGLMGAQLSTRFLPRLSDKVVITCFNTLLILLAIFTFWQARKLG